MSLTSLIKGSKEKGAHEQNQDNYNFGDSSTVLRNEKRWKGKLNTRREMFVINEIQGV